jgi:hypothetical protein
MRLPIFQDNPVYLNLANMLPYYTLNIFQDPERGRSNQEKTLGGAIARAVDMTPFFKTPEGQVMFDYFIQPLILRETNPRGMFDQPLWPKDASFAEKAFYTARGAAEPLTPGLLGYAGLATGPTVPGITEFLPNYRWRQLAYATQGKTSLGIQQKDTPMERTVSALSSITGVPYYRMKLQYSDNNK